jgi:SAD/SRA domain
MCPFRGNKALAVSAETKTPVRVIRGYKLDNDFAPATGYRYDGLYEVRKGRWPPLESSWLPCASQVVKYWQDVGLSGFMVYKFLFKRLAGQAPPPWTQLGAVASATGRV